MKIYNLMTGANFPGGAYHQAWIMSWVGILILIVLIMLGKKWLGEEEMFEYSYNWYGSLLGIIFYYIFISLVGNAKFGLLIGLLGILAGGYGVGLLWSSND